MIEAEAQPPLAALTARLARKAARLAEARAENGGRARRDPGRWRSARLLWPTFAED
jgi:hypothetical protein